MSDLQTQLREVLRENELLRREVSLHFYFFLCSLYVHLLFENSIVLSYNNWDYYWNLLLEMSAQINLMDVFCCFYAAGGQRVQIELLYELHKDILESRAEERESGEKRWSNKDGRVEGTVQGGAGGDAGRNINLFVWLFSVFIEKEGKSNIT